MLPSSPPKALSFVQARQKVSSFEKVLVSAVNDWSGDRTEGKEMFDWIGIGRFYSCGKTPLHYAVDFYYQCKYIQIFSK
jgi:hypothetical protein